MSEENNAEDNPVEPEVMKKGFNEMMDMFSSYSKGDSNGRNYCKTSDDQNGHRSGYASVTAESQANG